VRRPILIEHVRPAVDGGRFPVKREVGDRLEVSADILKEGHERLAAVIRYRAEADLRLARGAARARRQ
jgi:starch synthase (maltosyl-transferring)